jgi:outer membrane protein, heavy metal efflux system
MFQRYLYLALFIMSAGIARAQSAPPAAPPMPAASVAESSAPAAPPLSLQETLLKAEQENPDILAARQAWKVKVAEVRPAGSWENPTFSFVDENFPSGTPNVSDEKIRHYRIEQKIPFPGKLTGESRMKYHEALIAESDYRAKSLDVLRDVRMRFYQLYLTDQKIILAKQSVDILKDAMRAAQGRVGSNQSSTSDVFMAGTELGKMNNELFQAQQERTLVQIELNTLLNQPVDTPLGAAQAPTLKEIPLGLKDLETLARRNAPDYLAAIHEIDHAQAMVRRNRLDFAPDFGLMVERETTPDGPAGRQIGFSVSFPLWFQRPWGQYQSAKAHLTESQAKSQAMQNEVMRVVNMEFVETNTHLHLSRNYVDAILPSALSNVKIARQQYASGQADFVRLLEAFRTWIDVHNAYQEQLYHYGEHWSYLERWIGVELDRAREALDQHQTMPMEKMPHAE